MLGLQLSTSSKTEIQVAIIYVSISMPMLSVFQKTGVLAAMLIWWFKRVGVERHVWPGNAHHNILSLPDRQHCNS